MLMFIADTHCDTLFVMGMDKISEDRLMVTPERIREGGVRLQTLALWTGPKGNKGDVADIVRKELSALPRLTENGLKQIDDPRDAVNSDTPCVMLSIEGGEVFKNGVDCVDHFRGLGVRMAALLWNNENALGFPAKSGSTQGLKSYGFEVVARMQAVGMAVDTSHLNEAGFWDILQKTDIPPLASHSCCKVLCDHFRNLSDDQIRAMIDKGGYIGVNFYPAFLSSEGKADAARVAEHIDHICQLGGAGIVGFGSDFDGIETTPSDIRHAGEVPNLLEALRNRGYDGETLEGIAGMNLVRYFERISPC